MAGDLGELRHPEDRAHPDEWGPLGVPDDDEEPP